MKEHKMSFCAGKRAEEWCAFVLRFLIYHMSACVIMACIYTENQVSHYLWMLLMLVPMGYLALVRRWVKYFGLALLLHVPVLFAGAFLGRELWEKLVITIFMVIMLLMSLWMSTSRRKKEENCPGIFLLALPVVFYFLGYYYLREDALTQLIRCEIMTYVAVFFIHENLHNTSRFIDLHRDTANFPVGQMTLLNRLMMALLLVVVVVAMLLFPLLHLDAVLLPVLRLLGKLLVWLLSFIHLKDASEQMQSTVENMSAQQDSLFGETAEAGLFWVMIEKVLLVVVAVVLVVLVLGGIAYLFYRLYQGFYAEKKENADEKEFLIGEIQWLPKGLRHKGREEKAEKGSADERIRRLYKRFVKKGFKRKETVPAALTPEEMLIFLKEKKADGLTDEERIRIREIYERARYGAVHCTEEELEELKGLAASRGKV